MKESLTRMVEAAIKAKKLSDAMDALGYQDTPYWDLYGMIADAIYAMIGEHADTFDVSITSIVLNDPDLTNEQRVEILLSE